MADSTLPKWLQDETICPCGEKAGPEFRYGLCDRHAREVPPAALLRFGASMGKLLREIVELRQRLPASEKEVLGG